MSEWSKATHTEDMSRRERARVAGVQAVIRGMMEKPYTPSGIPGEIGNVAIPGQLRLVYTQPDEGVGYTEYPDDAA